MVLHGTVTMHKLPEVRKGSPVLDQPTSEVGKPATLRSLTSLPASAARTRQLLGWQPHESGLLTDLAASDIAAQGPKHS